MERALSIALRVFLVAFVIQIACSDGGVLNNPLVRVSRLDQLPSREQRLAETAMPFDCSRDVALETGGIKVGFLVTWRVLDFAKTAKHGKSRFISAVQVSPAGDGRVAGVRALKGSASVGQLRKTGPADDVIAEVSVHLGWSGDKGCEHLERKETITIRADDSSCKKPKLPKLLRPVK